MYWTIQILPARSEHSGEYFCSVQPAPPDSSKRKIILKVTNRYLWGGGGDEYTDENSKQPSIGAISGGIFNYACFFNSNK